VRKGASEIVLVLDRSGSMRSTKGDAEGGLREFIAKQRVIPGECRLTFYRFDNEIERVFEEKPLERVEDAELKLEPRGSTALLDAMSRAIDEVGARLAKRADYDRPEFVYFLTITDGEENASKTTTDEVFKKVSHQRDTYKWQFIFIGANQDAIATAAKMGIGAGHSLTYNNSNLGTRNSYDSLTQNISNSRITGQQVQCFSQEQRSTALAPDTPGSKTGGVI